MEAGRLQGEEPLTQVPIILYGDVPMSKPHPLLGLSFPIFHLGIMMTAKPMGMVRK